MESLQSLKRRQKGVQNINQITKAMELVSATKMRRSQEIALASRPYVFAALDLLANIARLGGAITLPALLQPREGKKTAYVVVTSDKGLAGSFNNAVLREFEKYAKRENINFENPDTAFFAIGQKSVGHLEKKVSGARLQRFVRVGDYTTIDEVRPIVDALTAGFLDGTWDRVITISTHFRSALQQEVLIRELLPTSFEALQKSAQEIVPETGRFADLVKSHNLPLFNKNSTITPNREAPDYLIEPSAEAVLEELAKHLIVMELYHLILEANASEHAARRLAMKNASDNAKELAGDLAIEYNKSRQAVITREILEITAGAESLK